MNLLFLLNNDNHAAIAFQLLLPKMTDHKIKILLSHKVAKKINTPKDLLELERYEKCQFDWQKKFGLEASFCEHINSEKTLKEIRKFTPDLIISIRFEQILQKSIINIPRFGVLNLHSGILPNYRGVLASFWAILNGEKNLGTTLHYIQDHTIDTGDIIAFSKEEIDYNSSLFLNIKNLYNAGADLLSETIEKISQGEEIKTTKQSDLGAGRYFSYPTSIEVEKFLQLMRFF